MDGPCGARVKAALETIGGSHVPGLLMRHTWPLALMKSATPVHSHLCALEAAWPQWVYQSPGSTGSSSLLSPRTFLTAVCRKEVLLCGRCRVGLLARQNRPRDSGSFVCQRDAHDLARLSLQELRRPHLAWVSLPSKTKNRCRTRYEKPSNVAVSLFADAEVSLRPATAMSLGREAQPRGQLSSLLEQTRIGDRSGKRRGRNGTDAGDGCQPSACFVRPMPLDDLFLCCLDLSVEGAIAVNQACRAFRAKAGKSSCVS